MWQLGTSRGRQVGVFSNNEDAKEVSNYSEEERKRFYEIVKSKTHKIRD